MSESIVNGETVESAVELIECATALGMKVRSPTGGTVYTAVCYLDGDSTRFVGVFNDEVKAKTAVTEEIIQWWRRCEFSPWSNTHYSERGEMKAAEWEESMRSFLEEKKVEGILSFLKSKESRCGTDWDIAESAVR